MQSTWVLYRIFKGIHLLGLIFWLGLWIGGYSLVLRALRTRDETLQIMSWRVYRQLARWKHAGFVLVLLGAVGMTAVDWANIVPVRAFEGRKLVSWWHFKAGIFLLTALPLEIADAWMLHGRIRRELDRRVPAPPGPGLEPALHAHSRLTVFAAFVLAVVVPLLFYLGLFKPVFAL